MKVFGDRLFTERRKIKTWTLGSFKRRRARSDASYQRIGVFVPRYTRVTENGEVRQHCPTNLWDFVWEARPPLGALKVNQLAWRPCRPIN